jgi:hypothetical protein
LALKSLSFLSPQHISECTAEARLMAEIIAKFQGKASDLKGHISLRFGNTKVWYGIQLGTLVQRAQNYFRLALSLRPSFDLTVHLGTSCIDVAERPASQGNKPQSSRECQLVGSLLWSKDTRDAVSDVLSRYHSQSNHFLNSSNLNQAIVNSGEYLITGSSTSRTLLQTSLVSFLNFHSGRITAPQLKHLSRFLMFGSRSQEEAWGVENSLRYSSDGSLISNN